MARSCDASYSECTTWSIWLVAAAPAGAGSDRRPGRGDLPPACAAMVAGAPPPASAGEGGGSRPAARAGPAERPRPGDGPVEKPRIEKEPPAESAQPAA